ncbi:MAG: zinc-binding dehydrogenase [Actinobacteria bacterium]|nr:zinc-binding dehydrogenase [Actinomycetota bacterium]
MVAGTMMAAVYHGNRDIRVEEVPTPTPGPGELLLEVHSAGVCGTDASEYAKGPFQYPIAKRHPVTGHLGPFIPGHEPSGRVVSWGTGVTGYAEGDLVASGAGISCGECPACRVGHTNFCKTYNTVGLQRNGSLAQYCVIPASCCLNVTSLGLTDDAAALSQPMSIAVHSTRQGLLQPDQHALLVGAGGIGAFIVYCIAQTGARLTAVDLDAERLEIAQRLGAHTVIQAPPEVPLRETLEGKIDQPIDVVYEATAKEGSVAAAMELLVPRGRLVMIGLTGGLMPVDLRRLTLREVALVGTMAHAFPADFPEAVRLLGTRQEGWNDLAPRALPLTDLVEGALIPMAEGRSKRIKTLLDPWADEPRPTVT